MRARRTSRSSNPLLVASAAITRAIDPAKPSRITVIRLLGDALHTLKESQLTVDAIRLRSSSYSSREKPQQLNRLRLEADACFRAAHEQGARSLFSVAVSTLLKLPCRAGPLRRRAIDIIHIAGHAAGPAVAMQAVDRARAEINNLKKLSWSESEAADFEVSCAVLTLADLSNCMIAGREVARESILFLLTQRVRQKCGRNDLARAIAQIVQSIPPHAPPNDRLVDDILEFCFSSASVKQGTAGFGTALLAAVIVPFMVSRGPAPTDDVVTKIAKALRIAPTPTERAMWGLALVRASVTARRSTTYQLHKYGTSDMTSKFPREASSGGPIKFSHDATTSNASAWVSNEIFEESLLQVSGVTGFSKGRADATIVIAAVLRMWAQALPDTIPIIIPRTFGKLLARSQSVACVSSLVDAIWLGVLKHLKPSVSCRVVENLLPSFEEHGLPLAAALHVSAGLVACHGRQALRETGLTLEYNHITATMIKKSLEAVEQSLSAVRFGSVRLMSSIIEALPRTCSKFLAAVLQNLRIADLTLATKDVKLSNDPSAEVSYRFEAGEPELSSLLGNAAALAVLIEKVSREVCSVPSALLRQCAIDSMALLHPHHAREEGNAFGPVAACVRRRAGWGLVSAMARGKMKTIFEGESLNELITLWKEDLGFAKEKPSLSPLDKDCVWSTLRYYPVPSIWDMPEDSLASGFEEIVAHSSTRSAALFALVCALDYVHSAELKNCAETLVGSCAARIVGALANHMAPLHGTAQSSTGRICFATDQITMNDSIRRRYLAHLVKVLTIEAVHLASCVHIVPPRGDRGELCYNICVALIEESQRVLGEADSGCNVDSVLTHGSSQKVLLDSALGNSTLSLHRISTNLQMRSHSRSASGKRRDSARTSCETSQYHQDESKWSWLFGKQGLDMPSAERTFTDATRGVAAVVSQDLADAGILIEALSSAKVSATCSAAIALQMAKRMSHSHLAEINRVLAVLQLLARNSLGIPTGCQKSITSQTKAGRLYTPNSHGDGICLTRTDLPGSQLHQMAKSGSWLGWKRVVTDEGNIARAPFQNFHTRAFATMTATRTIAAEAHRELSVTGGPPLWIGMMRKLFSVVRDNLASSTPIQSVILCSAITTLGALLEVIPEKQTSPRQASPVKCEDTTADLLDKLSAEAVNVIAASIEEGKSDVQAAASLALSSCSHRVASSSELILAALLRAWSEDKGAFRSLGHFGRCQDEADIWSLCFSHIWSDMGIRELGHRTRFYCNDSHGIGSASTFFVTGAAAVLSSCKRHWWPLSESSYFTVKEMSTELLQWHGETAERAGAAGMYGMAALWAAKIDSAQAKHLTVAAREASGLSERLFQDAVGVEDAPVVPVEDFSLKDSSHVASPVGPFLDEVLYSALAPSEEMEGLNEAQDAACSAVSELFRGGGVEAVSANLPRLPETLFSALDRGTHGARRLMMMLVRRDAVLRPRYWFGLCRAICLNGERLNYGRSRSLWDLSSDTKSFAVYIASEAVYVSLSSCRCLTDKREHTVASELTTAHGCALNFLRKIVDFAKQMCRGDLFDYEACREACLLLKHIVSRFESNPEVARGNIGLLTEFKEVWADCTPILHKLMTDQAPHDVVNAATEAICRELILELRLQRRDGPLLSLRSFDGAFSFLELGSARSLKKRIEYLDQGEEVGIHAKLCMLATCARLVSALRLSGEAASKIFNERMSNSEAPERLLFSICGDFVSTLRGHGLSILARYGGSVTQATVHEARLQTSLFAFVTPIVLGSVSCFGFGQRGSEAITGGSFWENRESAGVRMSRYGSTDEVVVASALMWLLMHEHGDVFKKTDIALYHSQCQEALESLCYLNGDSDHMVKEVFIAFCNWDTDAFLSLGRELSRREEFASSKRELYLEIVLSVVMTLASSDIECVENADVQRLEQAMLSLSALLVGSTDLVSLERQSAKILDVVFALIERGRTSPLAASEVLPSLCDLVTTCMAQKSPPRDERTKCFAVFKSLYFRGLRMHSTSEAKLGAALCAAMCSASFCSGEYFLSELLIPSTPADQKTEYANFALDTVLATHGVENVIASLTSSLSTKQNFQDCQSVVLLLTKLGTLAVHGAQFSTSAALRCAISAVLVEGKCAPVVNKLGMVVYTALLSRLIFSLPTSVTCAEESRGTNDESYLLTLLREDMSLVKSFASSLCKHERIRTSEFISAQENAHAGP